MPTIQKVFKQGNSRMITIPASVIRNFEREHGVKPEEVEVDVDRKYNMSIKLLSPVGVK
jgi:antitoxin component of MazEF toxin-antitoxin module